MLTTRQPSLPLRKKEYITVQLLLLVIHTSTYNFFLIVDLLEAMESCLQIIKAYPFLLDIVFDLKEWLAPFAEELHAHTQPKCFKFVRNEQGKCEMYYRNYSNMQWEGPQQLLKVLFDGFTEK